MSKLEKAKEFYLRGFGSTYIKRRLGISNTEIRSAYPEIDTPTIIKYQISYIKDHYTIEEIITDLRQKLSVPQALNQVRRRDLCVCGCGFGPFDKVFDELLGHDIFIQIKKECEEIRSQQPKLSGREARRQTMLARYGCEGPNGNPEIAERMLKSLRNTNQERYGVDYATQRKEVADLVTQHRQETMVQRYGAPNSVQVTEIRNKILEKRAENGTLTSSIHEKVLYELLIKHFGADDVIYNYLDKERYPYYVDFYIPSRDLFVELNADASHGKHWYDKMNPEDVERKEWMLKRAVELDELNAPIDKTHKSRYWNYVHTWTELDVEKRETARRNNLNYIVFWDDVKRKKDGMYTPRLKDVYEWLDAGCPDSADWKKKQTW